MNSTGLAPLPALVSVALVNLARLSAWLQVITLVLGCAVSIAMLIDWIFKSKRDRAEGKMAAITLKEAQEKAKVILETAEKDASQRLAVATQLALEKLKQ